LGWLVGAWYCRSLCRCLGMLRKHMIWVIWFIAGSEMDGASNIYYNISTTSRTDSISVYRPGRARAGDVLSFYDVYCRLATSVYELWPRRSTLRYGAPSSSFVPRERAAISSFVLPPSRWPTPAGRRGHVRTAAVHSRDISRATIIRINTSAYLHSVGTHIYPQHISLYFHLKRQHRAVSSRQLRSRDCLSVSESMDAFVQERFQPAF